MIQTRRRMKCAVAVFVFLIAAVTATPVPQPLIDNVHREFHSANSSSGSSAFATKEEDWHLVPDADGKMHLVDIRSVDSTVEPLFNAFTDVVFRLFTRSNRDAGQAITIYNDAQLAASNFNPAHRTQFQIHGWNGGGAGTGRSTASHLLDQIECNFIGVDWGAGARTPNYILARNRVNDTGAIVALYADWLNTRGVPYSAMTFVGHSLGAQVAGLAGKKTRGLVHAVVALDPAGPLFSLDDPSNRFHHTDAQYVESIITDGGRLGFEHPVGHANFYVNWGSGHPIPQPGCGPIDPTGQCGHSLVASFYAASVNPAHVFGAIRCRNLDDIRNRNCVVSGPSRRMRGEPIMDGPSPPGSVFFLATHPDPPFAQGPR